MRAGVFGGTFNPIHKGHLKVAELALQRFCLDRLYLVPCRVPPHKASESLAPTDHRMRMLRLALPDDGRLHASDVEIRRDGPSYTIDTVMDFKERIVPGADLYLVMGLDAFLDIHTWKHYRRLLKIVQPVVVNRRVADASAEAAAARMDDYIRARLSSDYRLSDDRRSWRRSGGRCIHLVQTAPVDISSTQIRELIRNGATAADLVPSPVWGYIEQEELYR